MTPRWDADLAITTDDARAVIESQFPELVPATLDRIGEGWDNVVIRVNDRWVFRFPRREIAVALLESEALALPIIARHVTLPVPEPRFTRSTPRISRRSRATPWIVSTSPTVAAPASGDFDELHAAGVIDWDDVHLGDPACDLTIAFSLVAAEGRAAFRDGYGPIDDDTWRVAHFRALYVSVNLFQYATETSNETLARETRVWLDNVAS